MGSDGYFRGLSGIRPRPARAVPVLHNERQARLQRVSEEGRGRASCASAGVWGGQGPSIMRISGCLGRAGAEHHASISGCLGRAGGVWGASNPVQSKSNEIKFRWTCEKQIHGGEERGGEGVLQVIRIRIERTLTGKQQL